MKYFFIFSFLFCINCKANYDLDKDPNVLYWEIIDDSLHIYTKQDSIRDKLERWRYKDSIYRADSHDTKINKL